MSENLDLKGKMYADRLVTYALEKDKNGFNQTIKSCPENLKLRMYAGAIAEVAIEGNEDAIDTIIGDCHERIKGDVLSNSIAICANKNKKDAIKTIEDKSNDLKDDVLAHAVAICAANKHKGALKVIERTSLSKNIDSDNEDLDNSNVDIVEHGDENIDNSDIDIVSDIDIIEQDNADVDIVEQDNSTDRKEKIATKAMTILAIAGDKDGFNIIKDKYLSNADITKKVLSSIIKVLAESNKNEALKLVEKACPKNLKVELFAQTIATLAIEGDNNALKILVEAYPVKFTKEIIDTIVARKNSEGLKVIEENCPKKSLEQAIFTGKIRIFVDDTKALKGIINECPEHLRENRLCNAVKFFARDNNSNAIKNIEVACGSTKIVDRSTLVKSVLKITIPQKEKIFAQAIKDLTVEKNEGALKNLLAASTISEKSKGVILSRVMVECVKAKNKESLNTLINACPDNIKLNVLSATAAKLANAGILIHMLLDACPDNLKKDVIIQGENISTHLSRKKALKKLKKTYLTNAKKERRTKAEVVSNDPKKLRSKMTTASNENQRTNKPTRKATPDNTSKLKRIPSARSIHA